MEFKVLLLDGMGDIQIVRFDRDIVEEEPSGFVLSRVFDTLNLEHVIRVLFNLNCFCHESRQNECN